MTVCKAFLENGLKQKFINYSRGFYIIAILENTWKYGVSDSKEDTYCRVPLQQIWKL